jgi:hypothetical protein
MIPRVKLWLLTVERCGKIHRVGVYAPTRLLAVLNYRSDVSYSDVILSVGVKRNKVNDI